MGKCYTRFLSGVTCAQFAGFAWGQANPIHAQLNAVIWLHVPSEHSLSYVGEKTGATSLVQNISGPIATLVQNQMTHSIETHARFYRVITGATDDAVAFCSMKKLRQQQKPGLLVTVKKPSPSSTEGETASCGAPR